MLDAEHEYAVLASRENADAAKTAKEAATEVEPEGIASVVCSGEELSYVDVEQWYHDVVDFVINKGMMSSNGDGTFAPEDNIDGYAQAAVAWAVAEGVVKGVGDNKFNPDGNSIRSGTFQVMRNYYKK